MLFSGVGATEDRVDVISGVVGLELVKSENIVLALRHQLLITGVRSLPQSTTIYTHTHTII